MLLAYEVRKALHVYCGMAEAVALLLRLPIGTHLVLLLILTTVLHSTL